MIKPMRAGLALGGLFAAVHIVWSICVALGWGQAIIDWVWWAHMVKPIIKVGAFDPAASITVIVVFALAGYAIGNVFAHIWNKVK